MEGSRQINAPAVWPPRKNPWYLFNKGANIRFERRGEYKIRDPTGDRTSDPSVLQLLANRYTD
jgi:hypothetical protein